MQDALAHLLAWKGMAVLLWLAVVFVAERLAPAAPFPIKAVRPGARLLGNATLWMINAGLSVAVVVPVTAWAAGVAPAWRPAWWSGSAGHLLGLLALAGLIYWRPRRDPP